MSTTPAEEATLTQGDFLPMPIGSSGLPQFQTFDRRMCTSAAVALTSATLYLVGITLPAGKTISGITFVSGAQAESGGSNLWYALYKGDLTLMAQATSNTGAAAFAANTAFRMALTAAQVTPYTGLYYLGFCCVATQMPTLLNVAAALANANGSITGMTPILAASSTAALTGTAPNPAGALTTIVNTLYAFAD